MPRKTHQPDPSSSPPTTEQTLTYDRLFPMLEAAHKEMSELSKKKQDGVVNALKIRTINRLLTELSKVLEGDASSSFVDMLDEETIPQNSDVVLILSQWQAALTQYRAKHYGYDSRQSEHRWFTIDNPRPQGNR